MPTPARQLPRTFKTKFFAKQARKAAIHDAELCRVLAEIAQGKAVDLGGGVYKKRLSNNAYRSIVLAKSDAAWVLEFLFAKNEADNITDSALEGFRVLASGYARLMPSQLKTLVDNGDLQEICHDASI